MNGYVGGNPLGAVDPLGLYESDINDYRDDPRWAGRDKKEHDDYVNNYNNGGGGSRKAPKTQRHVQEEKTYNEEVQSNTAETNIELVIAPNPNDNVTDDPEQRMRGKALPDVKPDESVNEVIVEDIQSGGEDSLLNDISDIFTEGVVNGTEQFYIARFIVKMLHYEVRDKLNGEHPAYDEVIENPNWILLPKSQSKYHDNGIGKPELKYIHLSGREAVFDGDTHDIVTDPKYKATYNYINAEPLTKIFNSFSSFLIFGTGHFITDMLPFYLVGEKNERNK